MKLTCKAEIRQRSFLQAGSDWEVMGVEGAEGEGQKGRDSEKRESRAILFLGLVSGHMGVHTG